MHDNDFDKIFSHKFGQLPGEPYNEEGWSELSRRMDAHERKRWRWALPVLFFLLGSLAGGNVFWWYQWREATRNPQRPDSRTTLFQTDTIMRRTVVYRYDTIYQNVPLVRRQEADAPVFAQKTAGPPSNLFSNNHLALGGPAARHNPSAGILPSAQGPDGLAQQQDALAIESTQERVKQQLANGDAAAPGHTVVHKTPVDTSEQATPPPAVETTATDTLFDKLLNNQPLPTKKAQSPFLYFARPRLGFSAMWGSPSLPHKRSGSVWGVGVRADMGIARNFRLGGEIAYQQASLKSDETQALEDLDIPIPEPNGDYRLKYWETYFLPTFTYALHLRYEIPLRGNWTPWIGLGGQAATCLPFEIEYEFENTNDNVELHIPAKAEAATRWQGMLFMLGAEYRLNQRLYFGAESYLLRSFNEEPSLLDNQFGLKTSLLYKF